MLVSRRTVLAATAALPCVPLRCALAQDVSGNISVLDKDQSRSSLFQQFIAIPAEKVLGESFVLPRSFLFPKHTEKDDKGAPRIEAYPVDSGASIYSIAEWAADAR